MINFKECNEQIRYLQQRLNRVTSVAERVTLVDTLTFYLDIKALLIMQGCNNKVSKEEEN